MCALEKSALEMNDMVVQFMKEQSDNKQEQAKASLQCSTLTKKVLFL